MDKSVEPRLVFSCDFDERTAIEVEHKGWFEQAVVQLPNGIKVPVAFRDPVRLAQDLEVEVTAGRFCFAEPGLIVVPKVTQSYMAGAVKQLFDDGYFDRLTAIGEHKGGIKPVD